MDRVVGRIEVDDDLLAGPLVGVQEAADEQAFSRVIVVADLLGALGPVDDRRGRLAAIEGALAGERVAPVALRPLPFTHPPGVERGLDAATSIR